MKKPTQAGGWILLITFTFLLTIPLSRAQVFVNAAANGANNGTSWSDAYSDLNLALTNTTAGEIWVAAGTYKPVDCNPCSEPEKETSFQIPPGVQLYGGFEGTETALGQRDFDTHLTILSGDIGVPVDSTDNSYKIMVAVNATASTVLDGFIVEEGNADGSFGFSSGGGLYIDASDSGTGDIRVRNCTFRENYGGGGGGVAIDCVLGGQSDALFEDCLFEGNTASLQVVSTGAAVFMQGNSAAQLRPHFVRCTFRNNYSGNDGGAIAATPTGAGTLLAFEVDSCRFTDNRADDRGAAIWYRMSSDGECQAVIKNSQFIGNQGGGQGAAIYARSSFGNIANDTILNCVFRENITDGSSTINEGEGGAVFLRGSQEATRNHHIINCLFDRNQASERGGAIGTTSIVASPGTLNASIINCTFYGNSTQGEGGAIHAEGSEGMNTASLANSILWGDTATLSGMEIFNNGASFTIAYSDIAGGLPPDVTNGGNNLMDDPQFLNPGNSDFRISSCSPARDTGSNDALPLDLSDVDMDGDVTEQIDIDLDGENRIFGNTIDLGALEWNGEPPEMALTLTATDVSCNGLEDGQAEANPTGGVGGYSYQWSNGQEGATIIGLELGIYAVTVSDALSCLLVDSVTIVENEPLMVVASGDTTICAGEPLTLLAEGLGGNGVYSFNWDNGLGIGPEQEIAPADSTTFIVTLTDGNNCLAEDTVAVSVNELPEVQITGSATLCPGSTNTLESSATFMSYLWQDSTNMPSLEVTEAGLYSLTVTDANGCMGSAELQVEEGDALMPTISGALSFCAGDSTVLDAGDYVSYLWSTGDSTPQLSVSVAGSYGVTVSDASGCEGEAEVGVQENALPQVEIVGSPVFCAGGSTTLGSSGIYESYLWPDGSTAPSLEVATAGLYSLTVTDSNGCEGTAELLVEEGATLMPVISGALSFCAGDSTVLDAGDYVSYLWSTGDSTPQLSVSVAGSYGVTVSDASGCEGEAEVEVTSTAELPAIVGPDFSSCSETISLSANLPEGTSGEWSTTGPVVINNPADSVVIVNELAAGINLFIWTLSAPGCPEYSSDSMQVMAIEAPLAMDDQFILNISDGLSGVFDLLANDQWPTTDDYEVQLLTEPMIGRTDSLEDGFLYYQLLESGPTQETLVYELCSDACPEACSEALITIVINQAEKEIDIPNGITPNGDGLNDTFVFEIIDESDPEDIPDNRLIIFNRWGDIVYDQPNYDNTWNGVNERGEPLPRGTYYYVLYLNIADQLVIRGDVTIVE